MSIIANGEVIVDEQTLDGPLNPMTVDYDFGYNGYNYVKLYAHTLGSISPNTCTISINGTEYILEANLEANGSVDIVVGGYGISCTDNDKSPGLNNCLNCQNEKPLLLHCKRGFLII